MNTLYYELGQSLQQIMEGGLLSHGVLGPTPEPSIILPDWYYSGLEKRDPEFDRKMREVLLVYQDVSLVPAGATDDTRPTPIYTVSIDEKPGIQAIALTAPDLPPVPKKESSVARDYEYVRHGTLSILAALDLHTGEIIATLEPRHRSREFIDLLKRLDSHYPVEAIIRVVLDNHLPHAS